MSHLLQLLENAVSDSLKGVRLFPRLFILRGEVIFRQDEPGDCLYLVRSGRLRVIRGYGSSNERVLGEVARGECIGEMALLAGGVRSATAVAIRDTELIRVAQRDFNLLGEEHPRTMLDIMRVIAQRLERRNREDRSRFQHLTLTVLSSEASAPAEWFCQMLAESANSYARTRIVGKSDAPADSNNPSRNGQDAKSDPHLTGWLSEREQECDLLILRGDSGITPWNRRCLRQADVILLVVSAGKPANLEVLSQEIQTLCGATTRPRVELVLVHENFPCRETGDLLSSTALSRHHHIRTGCKEDVARVARILTGNDVNLVLGGGGARGFAEIGVIKAVRELGVPIDRVCGTSMGAVIGAHYALFQDWERARNDLHREFVVKGRLNDYTLPFQSMILGRRYERLLENLYGETRIEDLPLNFFCMSCNLTCAASVAHRSGLLWRWLSASISIPGMAPPLVHNGELYIDGGILNNLPVDVAREDGAGYVIAVDVSPEVDLKLNDSFEGRPGAWQVLKTWLPGKRDTSRYPSLFDVLLRTTELSSINNKNHVRALADCYLRLPVQQFHMFEWNKIDHLIELGYRNTMETLGPMRAIFPQSKPASP